MKRIPKIDKKDKTVKRTGRDLTDFIKLQLMKYWRFDRGFTFVCSECINNSDISALSDNFLVEVEIKISKSDFLKEFDGKSRIKSYKHQVLQGKVTPRKRYIVPNYYYFCVPQELAHFVNEYLTLNGYTNYGILICGEHRVFNKRSHIFSMRAGKKIHDNKPSDMTFKRVGQRVQSEMITLKEKLDNAFRIC